MTVVVDFLQMLWSAFIEPHLITWILGLIGLSGGIYVWFAGIALNEIWSKLVSPFLNFSAASIDENNKEASTLQTYEGDVKKGDLNAIAKDGQDLLNG